MSKTVRCSEARSRVFSAVSFPRDAAQLALSHAATLGEYIYIHIYTQFNRLKDFDYYNDVPHAIFLSAMLRFGGVVGSPGLFKLGHLWREVRGCQLGFSPICCGAKIKCSQILYIKHANCSGSKENLDIPHASAPYTCLQPFEGNATTPFLPSL